MQNSLDWNPAIRWIARFLRIGTSNCRRPLEWARLPGFCASVGSEALAWTALHTFWPRPFIKPACRI
jgi:hypothetical protein